MKSWFLRSSRPVAGLLLCSVTALGTAMGLSHHPLRVFLPILFVFVIVLLAMRYGMLVGVLGPIVAALIFAYVIYPPIGSFRVSDAAARANLAWMAVGSIALSFLLSPAGPHGSQRK